MSVVTVTTLGGQARRPSLARPGRARHRIAGPLVARPRQEARAARRPAAACVVAPPGGRLLSVSVRVKMAAVLTLGLLGAGVSAAEFFSWGAPEPAVEVAAQDPGWAHVTGR